MPKLSARSSGTIRLWAGSFSASAPVLALSVAALGLGVGLGLTGAGCGGAGPPLEAETPVAALGSSREAQTEYLALIRRWSRATGGERAAMEPDLAAFRARYPSDGLGRVALALMSWASLERGDLDRAESLSRVVQGMGAGTARDIALVVEGATLRRRGRPEQALEKLSPIVSRLIDSYVRALLNEEVVTAALLAKKWAKAVELMDVWLREADPEEHGGVRARIEQMMPQVPPEELSDILEARLARGAGSEPSDDELDMRRILAQELARVARTRKDVKLAQRLMATSGPLLGSQGDAIAQLAAGSGKARVEAPTVGLLLSMRSDDSRRRSAEVAAGVMHGLGLPGSSARIVSRGGGDSESEAQEAMNALTAEGAAILIAGVGEEEAAEAATFAKASEIPVVLLRPPPPTVQPSSFVFVLGVGTTQVREALTAGLTERGAGKIALVAKGVSPIDARTTNEPPVVITQPCGASIDLAKWKDAGINGVLVDGDADCSKAVITAASGLRPVRFALGFEAASAPAPAGSLILSAGHFPLVAHATEEPWLSTWLAQRRSPPSFWAAMGRDAAVLAWAGVEALPAQGTEDPKEVKARRLAARDALARATAELWTTEARGFEGGQSLPRRLGVTETKGGAR